MKAFADLYRRLDSATSTRAKQAALVEAFAAAQGDPTQWASAAWMVYFLAGGKPRQTVPTRLLWRLAVEGSGLPEWLVRGMLPQRRRSRRDAVAAPARGRRPARRSRSTVWMRERLLPLPALDEEERYARLKRWVEALPADQRLAFFKLITGELRVGVSRLQVVKALAEVAGVEESRMAQRMIGYAQARRAPAADGFRGAGRRGRACGGARRSTPAGPIPSISRSPGSGRSRRCRQTLGPPSDWIVEWKFDGIRAQLLKRGDDWRLWSRGEELISDAYPDLEPLARALPYGRRARRRACRAGSAGRTRRAPTRSTASRRSRACSSGSAARSSATRRCASCRSPSSPTTSSNSTGATSAASRSTSAARSSKRLVERDARRGDGARRAAAAAPQPDGRRPTTGTALAAIREQARALGREGLMLKAREGAYGVGRRKGDDRTDVWWKWKLDPMSVDAVLIYAQRGHGRRSGVYSDYTFAVWSADEGAPDRELVPFAKAYSGLSDAEMREMDAIIRRTTVETFGPVRSVKPTQVFELGFEGIAPSKRHRSGVAVRFPRMLRWRRDKPVAEADTLETLRALLPTSRDR